MFLFVADTTFGDVGVCFVAGATFGDVAVSFSRQAQHLVFLERHFSWHAGHLQKCGKIAGAPNVVSSNAKMRVQKPND